MSDLHRSASELDDAILRVVKSGGATARALADRFRGYGKDKVAAAIARLRRSKRLLEVEVATPKPSPHHAHRKTASGQRWWVVLYNYPVGHQDRRAKGVHGPFDYRAFADRDAEREAKVWYPHVVRLDDVATVDGVYRWADRQQAAARETVREKRRRKGKRRNPTSPARAKKKRAKRKNPTTVTRTQSVVVKKTNEPKKKRGSKKRTTKRPKRGASKRGGKKR